MGVPVKNICCENGENSYGKDFSLQDKKNIARSELQNSVSEGELQNSVSEAISTFYKKLGVPNRKKEGEGFYYTKGLNSIVSSGKNSTVDKSQVTDIRTEVTSLLLNSPFFGNEIKVFKSFVEISEEMLYFNLWYDIYTKFQSFLNKELNEVYAITLLCCYKNKIIYKGLLNKILYNSKESINPGLLKRKFDYLVALGVMVEVDRAEIAELKELKELESNLNKYTQMGDWKIKNIHYYVLTEFGGVLVAGFLEGLEAVVPESALRTINDINSVIVPPDQAEEQKRITAALEVKKAATERKVDLRAKQEERLLTLCLPFKAEIMGLGRGVVMDKSKDGSIYSEELGSFVEKLQEKERLISPFGVRAMWQRWRR
ncbi:MAG: hypothetical protein KGD61_09045 [Candidatus Lokiarchaeota archaeon]|nr:hypothetical protein [Candidatus Lokiarchaeota archaeon]